MSINFVNPTYITNEYKIYLSNIDYENKFNSISDIEKEEIDLLSHIYSSYILSEIDYYNSTNCVIPHTFFNDNLPLIFKLYTNKNLLIENNQDAKIRIGLNVYMNVKNYLHEDYILYTIYYNNCNIEEDELKNYIANILFFVMIICKEFKYSPLLKYLCHEDDLDKLEAISKVHLNLFGNVLECSVCMENCIDKTSCNHPICLKCYAHLEKKICPICRKILKSDQFETYIQLFLTN